MQYRSSNKKSIKIGCATYSAAYSHHQYLPTAQSADSLTIRAPNIARQNPATEVTKTSSTRRLFFILRLIIHLSNSTREGYMDLSEDQEGSHVLEVGYYLECLKNHAASIGKYAVDGCCEFMPDGDEGSGASLRCAACSCHRNFHKKVVHRMEIIDDYGSDLKPSTPK